MPVTDRKIPARLNLAATLDLQAADGGDSPQRFKLVVNTGEPMKLEGFFDPVIIDLAGAQFEKPKTPVIMDHDTRLRIGHTDQQEVNARGIFAEGVVSSGMGVAQGFVEDARAGFPFQASVGAFIVPGQAKFVPENQVTNVNGKEWSGPLIVARKTVIRELSVTVLGADSKTQAVLASAKERIEEMPTNLEDHRKAIAAEELRVDRIRASATKYANVNRVKVDGQDMDLASFKAHAISAGMTADTFELSLIRAERERVPATSGIPSGVPAVHSKSPAQTNAQVIAASLLCRMGRHKLAEDRYGALVLEASRPYQSASLVDLARASLQADGRQVPSNRNDLLRASLGFSNATLSDAISDSIHTILQQQYSEANQSWRSWCSIKSAADFRDHQALQTNVAQNLDEIGKDGEVHHATIGDTTYTFSVAQYAKQLRLTRVDLVNDNVGAIEEVPMIFTRMALRKIADLVYSGLLGAGTHFAGGNGNLLEAGSDLDVTSLAAAIVAMRTQRDADNNDLDIVPRVLLVPPELQSTGQAVLESEFLERAVSQSAGVDEAPTGNPLRRTVKLEVESRLSNTSKFSNASTAGWYLSAGPIDLPFIVAFLNGTQLPMVDFFGLDSDPDTLGVSWRVVQDVGVAVGDPKAMVRATGAGS